MDRETLRGLIPAYALNALDEDERRQVETFLAEDESARQELSEYQLLVKSIGLTAPAQRPPEHLEAQLLARARNQRRRPIVWGLVAAAAAIGLVLTVFFISLLSAPPSAETLYAQVLAASDHVAVALEPALSPDISGQLVYRPEDNSAVIRVSNLPPLNADQAYQLWLVDDSGAVSGGIYRPSGTTAYIQIPATRPIGEYLRFGVSLEPATGSPLGNRASGPRVFSIPIQA
ncbi:MAG: anti-sigma factor [Anaerolineae bacterium]